MTFKYKSFMYCGCHRCVVTDYRMNSTLFQVAEVVANFFEPNSVIRRADAHVILTPYSTRMYFT